MALLFSWMKKFDVICSEGFIFRFISQRRIDLDAYPDLSFAAYLRVLQEHPAAFNLASRDRFHVAFDCPLLAAIRRTLVGHLILCAERSQSSSISSKIS